MTTDNTALVWTVVGGATGAGAFVTGLIVLALSITAARREKERSDVKWELEYQDGVLNVVNTGEDPAYDVAAVASTELDDEAPARAELIRGGEGVRLELSRLWAQRVEEDADHVARQIVAEQRSQRMALVSPAAEQLRWMNVMKGRRSGISYKVTWRSKRGVWAKKSGSTG